MNDDSIEYLVISALGGDRPGIVNELSKSIAELGCNILDSRMSVLGGEFALILMISSDSDSISMMEDRLPLLEDELGLTVIAKRTELRDPEDEMIPYHVEVVSLDHPGIVHDVAEFFSNRAINIENLGTSSYAAPHTGSPMFSLNMTIGVPGELHIAQLRDTFFEFCDELNLDAVFEPIKVSLIQ